jgi:hypothetical protein
MKKIMFTAIAMVAFSGVSMAGTLELEAANQLPIDKVKCQNAAIDYYIQVIDDGPDDPVLFNQLMSRCG